MQIQPPDQPRKGQLHQSLAWLWLGVLIAMSISLFWRLPHYGFDSGLLSLLPEQMDDSSQATERLHFVNQHLEALADRELFVLVGASDAQSVELAETVKTRLSSKQRVPVAFSVSDLNRFSQAYFPYRSYLLSPSDQRKLDGDPDTVTKDARRRLYSLFSGSMDLVNDPFWLFQNYLQGLSELSPVKIEKGWPTLHDAELSYRIVRFQLQGDAFDLTTQSDLLDQLQQLRNELPTGAVLLSSGLVVHAAYGAKQARAEISTVGVGSLVGVLLLLWLAFGRWRSVLALLLCVSSGLLAAFCVSLWLFDHLHLITLAFGASLIGVGIDYGIHTRAALTSGESMRRFLPALILGLLTSLVAYGVQGIMPFPGLQQMAMFSCAGLLAAWLSACLWLPWFVAATPSPMAPTNSAQVNKVPQMFYRWVDAYWHWTPALRLKPVWGIAVLAIGFPSLWFLPGDDRLSQLQTSPIELLMQEQKVQQLLQGDVSGRYFLVSARSEQALDAELTHLTDALSVLRDSGVISGFSSLHDWRPALDKQLKNHARIAQLYQHQLPQWLSSLGAAAQLTPALDALALQQTPLVLAYWQVHLLQPHLYVQGKGGEHLALVPVQGVRDGQRLQALNADNVQYVDRAGQLASLLGFYRQQLQHWTLAAVAVVLCILLWYFGWTRLPLVILPVISLLLASLFFSFGPGLTLFHCLALLLVLGIGFDSSIFLLAATDVLSVWRASTLSILTSMISFGLLALSKTPVLHFFGVTVLLGLGLVWLLLPAIYKGLPEQVHFSREARS